MKNLGGRAGGTLAENRGGMPEGGMLFGMQTLTAANLA